MGDRVTPAVAGSDPRGGWSLAASLLAAGLLVVLAVAGSHAVVLTARLAEAIAGEAAAVVEVVRLDRTLLAAAGRVRQPLALSVPAVRSGPRSLSLGYLDGRPDGTVDIEWADGRLLVRVDGAEEHYVRLRVERVAVEPPRALAPGLLLLTVTSRGSGRWTVAAPIASMPLP